MAFNTLPLYHTFIHLMKLIGTSLQQIAAPYVKPCPSFNLKLAKVRGQTSVYRFWLLYDSRLLLGLLFICKNILRYGTATEIKGYGQGQNVLASLLSHLWIKLFHYLYRLNDLHLQYQHLILDRFTKFPSKIKPEFH